MSNIEVRVATMRDAKVIAEIHATSSQAAFKALFPGEKAPVVHVDKSQAYWREAIEFSDPQVFVATDDGVVVGFVGFDRSRDAKTPATTPARTTAAKPAAKTAKAPAAKTTKAPATKAAIKTVVVKPRAPAKTAAKTATKAPAKTARAKPEAAAAKTPARKAPARKA